MSTEKQMNINKILLELIRLDFYNIIQYMKNCSRQYEQLIISINCQEWLNYNYDELKNHISFINILTMQTHFPTDLSQDITNQKIQQSRGSQQMLTFNVHPGFLCFFKDFVDQKGWTFYECYQNVSKSSHQLMKIKHPIRQFMDDPEISKTQKLKQLDIRSQKNNSYAYFTKDKQGDQIECFIVQKQKKAINDIQVLKQKLADLQKMKKKIVQNKKKQFIIKQKKRQEQMKKLQEQALKQKIRRANKVKEIQLQIKTKQQQKLVTRLKYQQDNPSSQRSCEIM